MRVHFVKALMVFLSLLVAFPSFAADIGQNVPNFQVLNADGATINLSDYKDKHVVLEWVNPACPFVGKHYSSGNMQKIQSEYRNKDVVWLSVYTKGESKFEFERDAKALNKWKNENKAEPTHLVMDAGGKLAEMFKAKTTPHMFVLNPANELIYAGAIDDKRGTKVAEIEGATNYVTAALDQALKGEAVSETKTKPYGCAVKY